MKFIISLLILTTCFLGLLSNAVQAQQATATLTGEVTDQNGAVISGATVTATNKATNLSRTALTNDEGVYVISSLPVGEYEVKISSLNFETKISESAISLNVGQTITLGAVLKIEVTYTTIDLIGEMPLIDTNIIIHYPLSIFNLCS